MVCELYLNLRKKCKLREYAIYLTSKLQKCQVHENKQSLPNRHTQEEAKET